MEITREAECIDFMIGDNVVYPHHGAGQVIKKEEKEILGEVRQYLTIKILHNDMTVMVRVRTCGKYGLRQVIDEDDTVQKVLAVLSDDVSDMPKNWNRRFKHNRDKIKTGDIYELAEVVRNLAVREPGQGSLDRREADVHAGQEDPCVGDDVRLGEDRGGGRGLPRRSAPALGPAAGGCRRKWARRDSEMAVALLVAAGSGERLGAGRSKAFVVPAGRPMLEWSLEALRAAGIDHVVVAAPPDVAAPRGPVRAGSATVVARRRCPLGVRGRRAGRRAGRRRRRPRCGATARDARALQRRSPRWPTPTARSRRRPAPTP